ncbi:MAG: signal peptidase I [Ignavibacteriales bacterium]|nr:Signal peptidase I [Ignavibacteriaceae bacterium]MBW7873844.1 signal peptidase I [Ignavibacteria bacterium]MBZ0198029.1 signal peptidase I [Ignavibacteriaceae bacterium]MCZ2144181.1 signal peptidase I [Ignavibacteriales bacterium]WKZ72665.1 MAG: signal peptidase I [Ignavibacteriaceae bacterium]
MNVKKELKSLLQAFIAALFIISFFFQNTRIPTPSMESTIMVGDFVVVNKFIYGINSPKFLPYTEVKIPHFRWDIFTDPDRGDIVVFDFPGEKGEFRPNPENIQYVKRCIGLPGDTITIRNKVVFVNGKPAPLPAHIQYKEPQTDSRLAGYMFPGTENWTPDNFGPFVVPKKGAKIKLDPKTAFAWQNFINREFEEEVVKIDGNVVYINGKPTTEYQFQEDYFFMMGDNRDDSSDSRFWGPVSRKMIVGEAIFVLFSWDNQIPFSQIFKLLGSIRGERILKILH